MSVGRKAKPRPKASTPGEERGTRSHTGSYFLSLEIENVRCFSERQKLDLSDGHGRPARWTILLGENGTGKTTLLQLLVAFELVTSKDRRFPRALAREFVDLRTFRRDPDSDRGTATLRFAYGTKMGNEKKPPQTYAQLNLTEPFPIIDLPPFTSIPTCYAYGAGRRLSTTSLGDEASDPTESLFFEEAKLVNAEEWLLRLDYSASKPSEIKERQVKIREMATQILIRVLPDVTDIRFTSPTREQPTPVVEFQTPYGWIPLRQLGYGYRTMIAWMVDFASRMVERYPDSPDPLAEPAVVLVDEIDLHLHPKWQRELIGFLTERFPNTQFIVTAHSPLIVQAAGDANIALLKRDGDHVTIENNPETIRGWRVDQILTSELFGLKTARPPELEGLLQRRKELLTKPKLTKTNRKELEEIESKIGTLPGGESFEQAKRMELIEKSLELLTRVQGRKP